MKFTAIAIDDEPLVLKDLAHTLHSMPNVELKATFHEVKTAFHFLVSEGPVDIIYCDIKMDNIDGLQGADLLSEYCDLFAFTTGFAQYTAEAYERGVDAYLMKPIMEVDILKTIAKLTKQRNKALSQEDSQNFLFVYDGLTKEASSIHIKDIISVCCNGNYVNISVKGKKKIYIAYSTMDAVEARLAETGLFIRLNRSTIVAKYEIEDLKENYVYLRNEAYYRLGKTYIKSFRRYYNTISLSKEMP